MPHAACHMHLMMAFQSQTLAQYSVGRINLALSYLSLAKRRQRCRTATVTVIYNYVCVPVSVCVLNGSIFPVCGKLFWPFKCMFSAPVSEAHKYLKATLMPNIKLSREFSLLSLCCAVENLFAFVSLAGVELVFLWSSQASASRLRV